MVSWMPDIQTERNSLTESVPIDIVHYEPDGHDTHRRLMSEFSPALQLYEERQKGRLSQCLTATVLPFAART